MPKFVIPKEIKFLSTLLPESNLSFDTKNIIDFSLKSDFINDISSLSRVVFSESPAFTYYIVF
jgi:hypothetical protein